MFVFNKKCGFTLSEVLVTLGLIGVLAAITLPNLAFNYRGKVLEQQFMSTYSDLKQAAIRLNDKHNGDWAAYVNGAGYNNWHDEFMAEFNGGNKYKADKSWQMYMEHLKDVYGVSDGKPYSYFSPLKTWKSAGMCDNGGVWTDGKGRIWTFNAENSIICVDINGPAKPNRLNIDNFVFIPMTSEMLSIWVYEDTEHPNDYSSTFIPCDYEGLLSAGAYNYIPVKNPNGTASLKAFEKGSGSALDYCPYYWPVTNAWPVDDEGNFLNSARNLQPRNNSATTYWKDYIEYR